MCTEFVSEVGNKKTVLPSLNCGCFSATQGRQDGFFVYGRSRVWFHLGAKAYTHITTTRGFEEDGASRRRQDFEEDFAKRKNPGRDLGLVRPLQNRYALEHERLQSPSGTWTIC